MRNPERIPIILEALRKVWEQSPDSRLGQLIANSASIGEAEIFYIEDDEMLKAIEKLSGKLSAYDENLFDHNDRQLPQANNS